MSIRKLALLTAVAALGLMALGSASASATTMLRLDPGNTVFTGSTNITNTTADPAVLVTNLGTVTCNSTTFIAAVTSHSSATSISGGLNTLTFTNCTDNIAPINITSCHLRTGTVPTVTITAAAGGGSVTIRDPTVRCVVQGSTNGCYYTAATAPGTANNPLSTISYSNVGVVNVTPSTDFLVSGLCGSTATFSTTIRHIVQQGTNKTVTITTS